MPIRLPNALCPIPRSLAPLPCFSICYFSPLDVSRSESGLDIRHGTVLIDPDRLLYPGDILHEAGHIAVASSEERSYPSLTPTAGDEIATLAWSWSAVVHLDLPPEVLFHPAGYKGGSAALIENFEAGRYIGVPLLRYYGMTEETGPNAFPHMKRWLRQ